MFKVKNLKIWIDYFMEKIEYTLFILASIIFLISCSDDSITKSENQSKCKLISYTDSSSYYYKVEYDNNMVSNLYYYKFDNNEIGELVRETEVYRNFIDEIVYINYKDSEGNVNFVDSVYSNSRGVPYEIVTYNSNGEYVEKCTRIYNNSSQVITETIYKYDGTWKMLSQSKFLYDESGRIIDRKYEQFLLGGSRTEHSVYEYDDMMNINSSVDLFTLFTKNNRTKELTTYTSRDSVVTTATKNYLYEYNEEGYPIKIETSSSSNENVSVRYNQIICD